VHAIALIEEVVKTEIPIKGLIKPPSEVKI